MIVSSIMVRIGKYKLGIAPLSMIAVFFVTSICAVVAAIHQVLCGKFGC